MDIQTEVQKIHHKYGVSEKANYEIQKLFEKYAAYVNSENKDSIIGESDIRWINVKESLPKDGDHVIFGANNISDIKNRLCRPMVMAGWFMGGKFYSYLTKEVLKPNFWMPMPILRNGKF